MEFGPGVVPVYGIVLFCGERCGDEIGCWIVDRVVRCGNER